MDPERGGMVVRSLDGKKLHVTEGGDPSGSAIFVLHGTPLSGRLYPPHVRVAMTRGIRLIGYDRPGYGGSDPRPERTVVDAARDVSTIADALHIPRFAVWGHSGGGPHALACAAVLPERVTAAAASSSIAPQGADGLDWLAGMGEGNIEEFRAARMGRGLLTPFIESQLEAMMHATGEISAELRSLLSPVDFARLSGVLGPYIEAATQDGLAPGPGGWVDDDLAFVKPWGFELDAIRVPVSIWHGKQDLFVPYAHSIWLAARVPGSELKLFVHEGHLSLLELRGPEILDWLVARQNVARRPAG